MNDNILTHYGALGMKWGRRRAVSAFKTNQRDIASLRKASKGASPKDKKLFNEAAKGLIANNKALNKKIANYDAKIQRYNREKTLKMVMKVAPKDWRLKNKDIKKMTDQDIDDAIASYSMIPHG